MLKNYLTEKGKAFTEKFIDADENARMEMMKMTGGFLGVPFISISVNGQMEKVIGFDKGKLETLLK